MQRFLLRSVSKSYLPIFVITSIPPLALGAGRLAWRSITFILGLLPMSSIMIAGIVFGCTFGGALVGIFLRVRLPEHHRNADSKDVLKLVMGLIATVAALVLGLLISSAKSSYDTQKAEVQQQGIHLLQLDHILVRFGTDAREARKQLRRIALADIGRTWPNDGVGAATRDPLQAQREGEELFERIASLSPKTDAQRLDQSRAQQLLISLWETNRLLDEQVGEPFPGLFSWCLCFGSRSYSLVSVFSRASTQLSLWPYSLARSPSRGRSSSLSR